MVIAKEYLETGLIGMKEICAAVRKSEATVLRLIQEEDFPATKIGGAWESDRTLITKWRIDRIQVYRIQKAREKQAAATPQAAGAETYNPFTRGKNPFKSSSQKIDRGW